MIRIPCVHLLFPRVSESSVEWNQFEVLDAGVDVRACDFLNYVVVLSLSLLDAKDQIKTCETTYF